MLGHLGSNLDLVRCPQINDDITIGNIVYHW